MSRGPWGGWVGWWWGSRGGKNAGLSFLGTFSIDAELYSLYCLLMESIRLGGPAHGIVTKTIHKTLPGGGGGSGGGWVVG